MHATLALILLLCTAVIIWDQSTYRPDTTGQRSPEVNQDEGYEQLK